MSKFVIEANGVKREVPLPCAVCISREMAYAIRDAMNQFIGDEGVTFGWVTIHREKVEQRSNSKPLSWNEAAQPEQKFGDGILSLHGGFHE